ncbi:MAG TPA: serine/threonine-protein kinase, partial [Longimicrobium sp.]|nr:serine/threonine-protein kinase [Longimicrobium sp.]
GPLPRVVALRVLAEAARGVAAGHRAGIVHRDVKPANVFLLGDGGIDGVKILDFGIAKPLEDDPEQALTTVGSLPHSPAYASPEQLDPGQPVTAASDVYQLGLIGYEMLAGRRPFGEGERALVRAGQDVPLPVTDAWRTLPPHVREVVQRALRPRPADRFPDAEAFVQALADARAEDDATALHVAAPVPDADATELLSATAGVPIIAPAPAEAPPRAGMPATTPSARRIVLPRTPVVWIVPLLLLLAAALWAARGRGGASSAAAPVDSARTIALDTGSMAALDDEFLRLQGVAASAASSAAPAPATPPPPSSPTGTTPAATPPEDPPVARSEGRAEAEAAITAAVHDLNRAWVEGDISRHVGHYASRVDYYNSRRLPRAGVRRDRTRDMRRYDDRRIGIHGVQVQWTEADRARVLVDKEWIFGADGTVRRRGRGVQEYIFKRDEDDGEWYVVSEQLLTTTEARSPAEP